MKDLLMRTGSVKAAIHANLPPTAASLSRQGSVTSVFSGDRAAAGSPKISVHLEVNRRNGGIRRSLSEAEVFKPVGKLASVRSASFPALVPEEMDVDLGDEMWRNTAGYGVEELGFGVGGFGKGSKSGGNGGGSRGSGGEFGGNRVGMGEYYQEMLKRNPGDPLLLRNYGKYLHEVEGNFARAEECYGRAILASPGDGELLSLYGKLIWDTQRDEERAESYYDRAVQAAPDDCTVLGSYAHFMWEAEDEEEEDVEAAPPMVWSVPTTAAAY